MNSDQSAAAQFDGEIARYNRWREELTQSVSAYHDWLESNGQLDVQQSIRFYDLLENLGKGRMMLAFLAEYSRGKTELINALFFSSFKERLLPVDVGRTTMCPTEIFHDPSEEPYLKLLSVETRFRDDSISQLKNNPVEWSKVRLDTSSPAEMKKALATLADTKKVYALDARMLGLAPLVNDDGELVGENDLIEVPAWRYAMINYPHPLLTNGLSILDTPGLNALGMEPELTVSTVPSAHAIVFLLSIDTGVTKSDLEIWERYVKPGLPQKIAVLNKIDLMWDELRSDAEIESAVRKMMDTTARALSLDTRRIFALSAQKALVGKIREDAGLVQKSGIASLEEFLAQEIVPMRRQILCEAVMNEIGAMMMSSRASLAKQQRATLVSIDELKSLMGKSREAVTKLWATINAEKNAYSAALAEYKVNLQTFMAGRAALMDMLQPAKLDDMLAKSARELDDSWTTMGLQRGMHELAKLMSADFERVFAASEDIKKFMQSVYDRFVAKFGFQQMTFPSLDLRMHAEKLKLLVDETDRFSRHPVNVANYKSFFVRKFYDSVVAEARALFTDARAMSERWTRSVTRPLETQISDHKQLLQSRLDSLTKINEKSSSIKERLAELTALANELRAQQRMIEVLVQRVSVPPRADAGARPGRIEPMIADELLDDARVDTPEARLTITRRAARAQEAFREAAPVAGEQKGTPAAAAEPPGERIAEDDRARRAPAFDPAAKDAYGAKDAAPVREFDSERTRRDGASDEFEAARRAQRDPEKKT